MSQRSIRGSMLPLVLLLLLLVGCQADAAPTLMAAAFPPVPHATAPSMDLATRVPTILSTVTHTHIATTCPSPIPTGDTTSSQLHVFDEIDRLVAANYLYPDFNGLNWQASGVIMREQIAAGMSDDEFYRHMSALIARLGDDHSIFQPPLAATRTDAIIAGDYRQVGIGVEVAVLPERNRVVLLDVFRNGPAWTAGLRSHDSILTLDGRPVLETIEQLEGTAGSSLRLTVQTPGQQARQVTLIRQVVARPNPVTAVPGQDHHVLYLVMRTFWDQNTAPLLRAHLETLHDRPAVSGLLLDLRTNQGGSEDNLRAALSLFSDGYLGSFIGRAGERPLAVSGQDVNNSQTIPLVLLVGEQTSSYAEVFAGVLQACGRAQLVGTVTRGNVETIWPHRLPDGSRLWLAEERFRSPSGRDWERDGIIPDFIIGDSWADFTTDTDIQLVTAIQVLTAGAGR